MNGITLYDGPSQIDGSPIICVATGIDGNSLNQKTGPMVQTWILLRDVAPEKSVTTGRDAAVCGACPLRGIVKTLGNGEQVNRFRGCYVFVGQAPQAIWQSYKQGDYGSRDYRLLAGKQIRIGSYGDPCAVPLDVWRGITAAASGWTGYTHQWRNHQFYDFSKLVMASVESEEDGRLARSLGWRTFRVAVTGQLPAAGEFHCPASAEQGYRKTCAQCRACDGVNGNADRASVIIWPHGPPAAVKSFYRIVRGDSLEIDHRQALNDYDREVLAALADLGRTSASLLSQRLGRGTQAVATRLWHLRQMGLVRRLSRGQYEAVS